MQETARQENARILTVVVGSRAYGLSVLPDAPTYVAELIALKWEGEHAPAPAGAFAGDVRALTALLEAERDRSRLPDVAPGLRELHALVVETRLGARK